MSDDEGVVDFVIIASREGPRWHVESVPRRVGNDINVLVSLLQQQSIDEDSVAFVSVDEDFFVIARAIGPEVRFFLSDVTAATDWPLAREVLDRLGLSLPDDSDRVQPAGDLTIFTDLGVDAAGLAAICDDLDRYPDEMLAQIATRAGFGPQFEDALG